MLGDVFQEVVFKRFCRLLQQAHSAPPGSKEAFSTYSKAEKLFRKTNALPRRIREQNHDYYHGMLLCIGARNIISTCKTLEEQTQAVQQYEQGVTLLANTEFRAEWAHAAINLADFYRERAFALYDERVKRAQELYEELLSDLKSAGDGQAIWHVFKGLIEIYFERAPSFDPMAFERGIALCEIMVEHHWDGLDDKQKARVLFVLGDAVRLRAIGDQERNHRTALGTLHLADEHVTAHSDLELWAKIRITLADVLISRPDLGAMIHPDHDAAYFLRSVIEQLEEGDLPGQLLSAKTLLLKCQSIASQTDAQKHLKELRTLCKQLTPDQLGYHHLATSAYFRWGEAALASFRQFEKVEFLRDAEEALKKAVELAEQQESSQEEIAKILGYLANMYECQERWHDAYNAFSKIFTWLIQEFGAPEKHLAAKQATHNFRYLFDIAPFVAAAVDEIEDAILWYEFLNAKQLNYTLNNSDFSTGSSAPRLRNLETLGAGALDFLSGERKDKWIDLLQRMEVHTQNAEPDENFTQRVRDAVASSDAWIALPLLGKKYSRTILLPPNKDVSQAVLSSVSNLGSNDVRALFLEKQSGFQRSYIEAFYDFERTGDLEPFANGIESAFAFVDTLFGNWLAHQLMSNENRTHERLVIVSNSILNMLPITLAGQTLHEPIGFAGHMAVSVSPSILVHAQTKRCSPNLVSEPSEQVGSIAFVSGDSDTLPTVDLERDLVTARFSAVDEEVAENSADLKRSALDSLRGCTYWHFATHGEFNTRSPMYSTLELRDKSKLALYEAIGEETNEELRLVVLSSCFVGSFDTPERFAEFTGFPSAFLQLGAKGVIGSIWPVSDEASTLLMSRFYDEHIDNDCAPALALVKAQRWLATSTVKDLISYLCEKGSASQPGALASASVRDQLASTPLDSRVFAHPFFWAGYLLYGE